MNRLAILRGRSMKRFIEGADRCQSTLLPECLDDWVDESNPVRAVDAFVDALELSDLGFEGVEPAATGRPGYHPSPLLKLYIYGYLNRIQSSRRLEREARAQSGGDLAAPAACARRQDDRRLPQGQWPGHQEGLRAFVELCRQMGLLDEGERGDRRLEVQGRQQPRQELHQGQGRAAAPAIGGERRALSGAARYRRSAGAVGGARAKTLI